MPELRSILVTDRPHPDSSSGVHVHGAIVYEHRFFRGSLGHLKSPVEDRFVRFSDPQEARAEKDVEIVSQTEPADAVQVQFQRLVIERRQQIPFRL
jgi:hypothetical protein